MFLRQPPITLSRRLVVTGTALALATTLLSPSATFAQSSYPNKPIKMLMPYASGGAGDTFARPIAETASKLLGQPIIIESKPGAGGILAAETIAAAPPDGYTFSMVASGILTINPSIYKKLPYDPEKSLAPLTVGVRLPLVLVVTPSLPVKTTRDVLAYGRANPGKLAFGSAGTGSSQHLAGELFKQATKLNMAHVPYKGGAPAMNDLIGGHLSMQFIHLSSGLPQIRAGKIRAIAVTGAQRSGVLPDVPTLAESGVPGYEYEDWFGFVLPPEVPAEVSAKLHTALVAGLREHAARYTADGMIIEASSPAAMAQRVKLEKAKWSALISAANIERQ